MDKKERAKERREKRRQEISLLRTIPYSDHQRWWSSETIAMVTGANRGIGFEIAHQLSLHGVTVILTSRETEVGKEAAKVLQEGGLNVVFHQLDVLDPSSIKSCTDWVEQNYGGLDILVNNAGVSFNCGSENSVEFAEQVIETNYIGTKNMIKAMIPLMRPSDTGARIVNVSSRLGRLNGRRNRIGDVTLREQLEDVDSLSEELIDRTVKTFLEQVKDGSWTSGGWPQTLTDYSISKLAVNAYTRLMAKILSDRPEGQKIYVNCYCPGWVKTAMTGWAGHTSPEEGADTAVWLALLPDQFVTGKFFAERREINFCPESELNSTYHRCKIFKGKSQVMVWGLFPAEPLSGEDRYYVFRKGTYKVGRKGCDIIINKDKGVSRIHAEIVIDAMTSSDNLQKNSSNVASKVRIRDCSKYGTFINKDLISKQKVHEFPNRETTLQDGDMVSFGTGNATYRFSFVPFKFFVCCSAPLQAKQLQEMITSIGASVIHNWSMECTHVLVDDITSLKEDLVDAIVAKRPLACYKWVEFIAEKNICTEIPSCSAHAPTLKVEGLSVKLADSKSRENCLRGYTFLLESAHKYQLKDRLQALLEVTGAKIIAVEEFYQSSQGLEGEGNDHIALVIPAGLADGSECFRRLSSLSRINETHLICATLSGHLDPSVLVSPPVVITSSCSTDETVVADSDTEIETATSVHASVTLDTMKPAEHESKEKEFCTLSSDDQDGKEHITVTKIESPDNESKGDISTYLAVEKSKRISQAPCVKDIHHSKMARGHDVEESDSKNSDIIYSQDLIIRHTNLRTEAHSSMNSKVLNFKRFRKTGMQSGNSFNNLIPFAKYPYKDSDYGSEEVAEAVKEEKRRKQMEAVAEDLFNNEKGKRRGTAGFLPGLFTRR